MRLPRYSATNISAKAGVNFVRTVVEAANSIFNEIPQQNDIGIDGIIEIIEGEQPAGHCIAVQIKSGRSFYNLAKNECHFPVDNHFLYWMKYPLPVYGLVYIPQNRCAYWINIKEYFEEHPQASRISYKCTKTNILRPDNFAKVFVPFVTGTLPEFTFEESWDLFHSTNKGEFSVGLLTLFRKYSDKIIVWDAFINYFRKTESSLIPSMFIYFLAHIPWHMDIFGGGDKITPESRHYVEGVINSFGKGEVIKLIQFIDENGIDRGSVGQSVVAIISSISERNAILAGIMIDETLPLEIREWANVLLLL